ncbi:TPA: hypothetical protein RRT60_004496, partial [Klebsiella pneumoniae]|nr:hypothetical protein [Klebsiella pneumoniae]
MGKYNTGNPVPSSAMPDVWDNNATIDIFVNSPELTITTRIGLKRDTMAGIEKKAADQRDKIATSITELQEHADQQIDNIAHSAAVSQSVVSASAQAAIQDINSTVTQTANDAAIVLAGLGYLPPAP